MNTTPAAPAKPIRSPSYPNASLSEALAHVRKIEQLYRSSSVDREVAAKLMGYSSLSGPANKALAALAQYGLVERAAKGEMRVTSRAQAILHPNSHEEQREQLRAAGMEPTLFRELAERFPGMIPPEEGVVTYLNRQGFNQSAIRPAAKAYLQTMRFLEESGVSESHGTEPSAPPESSLPESEERGGPRSMKFGGARVGDLIQWEARGELQFEQPARVRFVTDDEQWVAVDGSETGIPMSEVIVQERPAAPPPPPPRFAMEVTDALPAKAEGEAEWIRSDLGSSTKVRLLVKGDMGPKQIAKLIKLLEAQKAVLTDDVEDPLAQ